MQTTTTPVVELELDSTGASTLMSCTKMPRITQQDIIEMRARGYESATIESAQYDLVRTQDADRICELIIDAFATVTLGDGIGLWQAQGLDDYEDEETCLKHRERDEKLDWTKVSKDDLDSCNSSPNFLDAEGFRFYLPAFMISDLRSEYRFAFIYSLIDFQYLKYDPYELLSPSQRQCVREYRIWHRDDPTNEFARPKIEKALSQYWTAESCIPKNEEAE